MTSKNKELTITEAAKQLNITRQAIYMAIKGGKLKASTDLKQYLIDKQDLEEYKATKYDRQARLKINGKPLGKDWLTMTSAERLTGIPRANLYYATYNGLIKHEKIGSNYIYKQKDLEQYAVKFWEKQGKVYGNNAITG